jgi:hypothetical protein
MKNTQEDVISGNRDYKLQDKEHLLKNLKDLLNQLLKKLKHLSAGKNLLVM